MTAKDKMDKADPNAALSKFEKLKKQAVAVEADVPMELHTDWVEAIVTASSFGESTATAANNYQTYPRILFTVQDVYGGKADTFCTFSPTAKAIASRLVGPIIQANGGNVIAGEEWEFAHDDESGGAVYLDNIVKDIIPLTGAKVMVKTAYGRDAYADTINVSAVKMRVQSDEQLGTDFKRNDLGAVV